MRHKKTDHVHYFVDALPDADLYADPHRWGVYTSPEDPPLCRCQSKRLANRVAYLLGTEGL